MQTCHSEYSAINIIAKYLNIAPREVVRRMRDAADPARLAELERIRRANAERYAKKGNICNVE